MIFTPTKYQLQTVATGRVFDDQGWTLDDKQCDKPSMVRPIYEKKQLDVKKECRRSRDRCPWSAWG